MFNGHNRLVYGSVGSNVLSPTLTFHTTCCRREFSLSHALRLEKDRVAGSTYCNRSHQAQLHLAVSRHATAKVVPTGRFSRTTQPAPEGSLGTDGRRRSLHTSTRLLKNDDKETGAPAPSLPKRPISLLPPQSSLPKRPSSYLPPTASRGSSPGLNAGPRRAAGPDTSIPLSPIQERANARAEVQKREAEAKQKRQQEEAATLRKQREEQARIAKERQEEQARLVKKLRQEEQRRQAWQQKLLQALKTADVIESFGWANKSGVRDHLRLCSLRERGEELERRMRELYDDRGVSARSRDIAHDIVFRLKDNLEHPSIDWMLQVRDDYLVTLHRRSHASAGRRLASAEQSSTAVVNVNRSPRLRVGVYKILWTRYEAVALGQEMAVELHVLRRLRRERFQVSLLPELFSYHKLTMPLEHHLFAFQKQSESFYEDYHNFIDMAKRYYLPSSARVRKMLDANNLQRLTMSRNLARTTLFGLRQFNLMPMSAVQQQVLSMCQVYVDYKLAYPAFRAIITWYLNLVFNSDPWPPSPFQALLSRMTETTIKVWRLFDLLWLWGGISKLSTLAHNQAEDQAATVTRCSISQNVASKFSLTVPLRAAVSSYVAPWRHSRFLYPRPMAIPIPIYYVTSLDGLDHVVLKFRESKVLAFDTIPTVDADKGLLIQYLIVASEGEIAIFHLGLMRSMWLIQRSPFFEILEIPDILKVGVDIDAQRQTLKRGPGIQLENTLELRDGATQDPINLAVSSWDYRGETISSLATRVLGSPLPALNLHNVLHQLGKVNTNRRRIRVVGAVNPIDVIQHLASRAYALLQIYRIASTETNIFTSRPEYTAKNVHASLGPVLLYEQPVPHTPSVFFDRMNFLQELARHSALEVFPSTKSWGEMSRATNRTQRSLIRETALKRLTAYFLFTTYNENLLDIQACMQMPMIATAILDAVDDATDLKLLPEANTMVAWHSIVHEGRRPSTRAEYEAHETETEHGTSGLKPAGSAERPLYQSVRLQKTNNNKAKYRIDATVKRVVTRSTTPALVLQEQQSLAPSTTRSPRFRFADLSGSAPQTEQSAVISTSWKPWSVSADLGISTHGTGNGMPNYRPVPGKLIRVLLPIKLGRSGALTRVPSKQRETRQPSFKERLAHAADGLVWAARQREKERAKRSEKRHTFFKERLAHAADGLVWAARQREKERARRQARRVRRRLESVAAPAQASTTAKVPKGVLDASNYQTVQRETDVGGSESTDGNEAIPRDEGSAEDNGEGKSWWM